MAKKKTSVKTESYQHKTSRRKNIPPAKLASEGTVPVIPRVEYSYHPRLPPVLRFDSYGENDEIPKSLADILRIGQNRPLKEQEANALETALRNEPWLEWAGKRELPGFAVDPVALHIHERVSAQAILKIAARQDATRDLFADPEQEYHEAVQFYRHDIDWANRLILGDSLQVMASLAKREDLAGKVQMIYIDPPYGIKFASNFQPEVGKHEVKDKEQDLTREAEMVKAYRDTWHLGIHSYLSYLRDRLIVSRELLADSGSIFVQISDENLALVRMAMDEIFGRDNFIVQFTFTKKGSQTGEFVPPINEYVLWYTRIREQANKRFNNLYRYRDPSDAEGFNNVELPNGECISLGEADSRGVVNEGRLFSSNALFSQKSGPNDPVELRGSIFPSGGNSWKIATSKIPLLDRIDRALFSDRRVRFKRYAEDFAAVALSNVWADLAGTSDKRYVVQTNNKVIERCMLMTTAPGDLVLDPTCGSGTTAYVAEQWGRRWMTIDTSRVAISIARQRLLTAKYDYYQLRDEKAGVAGGFVFKTVPHITLKSIAQNQNLDPIFAKHDPILDAKVKVCSSALKKVSKDIREALQSKLLRKAKEEGKRWVTDADRRRWELPEKFEHWTVPFDADPDWPKELQSAVTEYRQAWRAKMDEVDACIAANAEQEALIDQPILDRSIQCRVSGPFTVEAVQPPEMSLGEVADTLSPIGGEPDEMVSFAPARTVRYVEPRNDFEVKNLEAYLTEMSRLLKLDGVRFPNNKEMKFSQLELLSDSIGIHAEGRWHLLGETDSDPEGEATVGVVFGPQYGPCTVSMIENLIRPAKRRYEDLVIAGFSFSAETQELADNHQVPNFRIHLAHIRPDVNPGMKGLLKEQPRSQLFTVFGQPRTKLLIDKKTREFQIKMEGVDIYDPVNNVIKSTEDSKVAAWFLDTDYDGRTFCITQAFFPDRSAWEKLSKALNGVIDEERFEALSGTESLPFPAGKHKRVAVKVIDPRGNEVMQVHTLGGAP